MTRLWLDYKIERRSSIRFHAMLNTFRSICTIRNPLMVCTDGKREVDNPIPQDLETKMPMIQFNAKIRIHGFAAILESLNGQSDSGKARGLKAADSSSAKYHGR